jgi:hypothetical protein
VPQVPFDIFGQRVHGLVPTRPVFLQRLHHDPVQIAAHQSSQGVWRHPAVLGGIGESLSKGADFGGWAYRLFFP